MTVSVYVSSCPVRRSLLSDMGARLWRVRQAAAAGLTELLSGRRWGQLAPHMEQVRASRACEVCSLVGRPWDAVIHTQRHRLVNGRVLLTAIMISFCCCSR
jgi:hypothetical protein